MPTAESARKSTFALGAFALVVLALLLSLALLVGRGGCSSAVAFDRRAEDLALPEEAAFRAEPALVADVVAIAASHEARPKRDAAVETLASVRGVVVDDVTGERVPHVELVLSLGPRTERIAVGESGRFASTVEFPTGDVRAVVADEGVEVGDARIAHDALDRAADARVEVPIGPTIVVGAVDGLAIEPAAWRARIVESALAPEVVGEIRVGDGALVLRAPSELAPDREWSWRLFRPGNRPWIRYPRREHASIAGVEAALELRDEVANRKGRADLARTVGVHDIVGVDTAAFAKARVKILRAADPEKSPMRAVLWDTRDLPLDGGPGAPVFDERPVGAGGEVEFADLDGGTKHLVAWSAEERVDAHFVIEPGPSAIREIRARRVDPEAKPKYAGARLSSEEDPVHLLAGPAAAEGRMRAAISSGSLQEAAFEMHLGAIAASGDSLEVRAVFADYPAEMRSLDAREVRSLFEVAPATPGVEILFGPSGNLFATSTWDPGKPLDLADLGAVAWSAWADGAQPVFGDEKSFERGPKRSRVARLELEPGWGAQIVLRAGSPSDAAAGMPAPRRDTRFRGRRDREKRREDDPGTAMILAAPPVPGVVLEIDGAFAGTSDAGGELRIRQAFRPERLTLVGRGWRLTALQRLPGSAPRYVAWLRRRP